MASKAAPTLEISSPAQQPDLDTPINTATTAPTTTTTAATKSSSSNNNNNSSLLPTIRRRRRDSSDDFGASESLGSIGGSAVGSSVEFSASGGKDSSNSNSNSNNNSKNHISPQGRRPFRKRKASVDFSFPALSIDDNNSSYSIANTQLLPQYHHATTRTTVKLTVRDTSSSPSLLGSVLPSPSTRSRLYSDLTMNDILPASNSSSKQKNDDNDNDTDKNSTQDNKQEQDHVHFLPSMDALPHLEDLLPPIDNDASSILLHPPQSPISGNTITNETTHSNFNFRRDRTLSFASSVKTEGHGVDRLNSLGVEASLSASRIRKDSSATLENSQNHKIHEASQKSSATNSYDGTLGSQSHRFLMEAFLGDGTESLVLNPSQRERLGSFDAAATVAGRSHNSDSDTNILISRERLASIGGRRDRLESWGGMSDLSVAMKDNVLISAKNSSSAAGAAAIPDKTASALAATIYTSLANDITAAAQDGNESVSSFLVNDDPISTRILVNTGRDRLNSVATDQSALLRITPTSASFGIDSEFPSDVQTFVEAAMASVEDQLADLATAVEAVSKDNLGDQESEISSTVSPMIGAASDVDSNISDSLIGRPRSSSISSLLQIAVDYGAVAAAVDAAEAAAGALDLTNLTSSTLQKKKSHINNKNSDKPPPSTSKSSNCRTRKRSSAAESLHTSKKQCVATSITSRNSVVKKLPDTIELKMPLIPKSKMDKCDMEKLRERARAAAGYVPPSGSLLKANSLPQKKRNNTPMTPSTAPRPSMTTSGNLYKTPITSNTASSKYSHGTTPHSAYNSCGTPASATKGQSSQKWESMFDCLLKFIEERKKEGTTGMTDEQKKEWSWDGNVPTTFKTKDGKALGRWVNNQRSAKSKDTLKDEREKRLVNAGLKWSVLASNSWNEMLEELRLYVADQVRQGKKWDGNVPTNYRIKVSKDKVRLFVKDDDEDKNLGRWVNRQRSMFQAGKLRKDRQLALENIGLKWSMLATTSWESMFETLCQYVEEKKKGGAEWDGNVPANYRTEDIPPRALGRWINRQRSAYGKNKLKPEYVAKLNEIGLKWSIHERRPTYQQYTNRPETVASSTMVPELVQSTIYELNSSSTPTRNTNDTNSQSGGIKINSSLAASGVQNNANVNDKGNETKTIEILRPDHIGSSNKRDNHHSESVDENTQGVATALATTVSSKLLTGVSSTELPSANEEELQTEIPNDNVPKISCPLIQTENGVRISVMKMHTTSVLLNKAQISSKDPSNSTKESVIVTKKATDSQVISVTPTYNLSDCANPEITTKTKKNGRTIDQKEGITSSLAASKVGSMTEIIGEKPVDKVTFVASSQLEPKGRATETTENMTMEAVKKESIDRTTVSLQTIEIENTTTEKSVVSTSTDMINLSLVDESTATLPIIKVENTIMDEPVDKSFAASSSTPANVNTSTDMINQSLVDESTATLPIIKVENTIMDEPVDKSIAASSSTPANANVTPTETITQGLADKSTALSLLTQSIGNATNIKQESIDESMEA